MAFGKKTELASEKAAKAGVETVASISEVEPGSALPVVATQETPVAAPPPTPDPPAAAVIPPEKQAELDKIWAEARKASEAILLGHPGASLGTPSGDIEDKTEKVQRDHLRGTRRKDKTYVPEWVYDEDLHVERKVLLHSEYKYMLVDGETIDSYSLRGYKMCLYDGKNGLTERGFRGTGENVFRRDIYGRCQRGDCFLMYIPMRGWLEIAEEDRAEIDKAMPAALGSFANAAYSAGIRPFIEAEGKSLT